MRIIYKICVYIQRKNESKSDKSIIIIKVPEK